MLPMVSVMSRQGQGRYGGLGWSGPSSLRRIELYSLVSRSLGTQSSLSIAL